MRLLLPLSALCALLATAQADHRDREFAPRLPRVILYEHANFRGAMIELHPGDAIDNLRHATFSNGRQADDRVSSVRVEGGAEVDLYLDPRFRGEVTRFTHDVRDLAELSLASKHGTWDEQVSSLRVGLREPGQVRDPDRAVRRAFREILLRQPDESGLRTYKKRIIDDDWTEDMVRDSLRHSAEYRDHVVNRIITRAYRDLLGREPDPRGLEHYRDMLINHGWSDDDLREDFRKSAEYRNRPRNPPTR
jgi:hypothetical protein